MSDKPRPYPTPTRLRMLSAIADGTVRHYWFHQPEAYDAATDAKVTVRVRELVDARLAQIPPGRPGDYSVVRLTEAGLEYLTKYSKQNGAGE